MDSVDERQMQNHENYQEEADDRLVEMCQSGENGAFDELMRRHQISAMKIALSIMRDKADAEDEVQNAFWKVFEHIDQFQHDAKFSTWLTRIVVNQCLMRLRQCRRAKFSYLDQQREEGSGSLELYDFGESPEKKVGRAEVAEMLRKEVRRTPPLLRNVFLLRDVEERPISDVANKLGISVAAAKSRLLRARAELRNRVERHSTQSGRASLTS